MQVSSSKFSPQTLTNKSIQPKQSSAESPTAPTDQFTFGFTDNGVARTLGTGVVLAATGAGAYYAGTTAAGFLPSGTSGVMGALTGAVLGGLAGGGTGLGLGKLSTEIWPSDQAGNGMTQGFSMIGGAVAGAVSGALAGYFGAQALIVAPAAVIGATVGATASSAAVGLIVD